MKELKTSHQNMLVTQKIRLQTIKNRIETRKESQRTKDKN